NGQTIATAPANYINAPVGHLQKKYDANYYPTYGYLTPNESIGKLWDSLKNKADLPLIRQHDHLKNGDTYLIFKDDIYFITENNYHLLRRWSGPPLVSTPIENDALIQLWKDNKIAVWKKGLLLPIKALQGNIVHNEAYMNGNCKMFWCPTGTFIFADRRLYRLVLEEDKVFANEVLRDLPVESPACIYYTSRNNTYYIGSLTQGLFVIKISDFNYPDIPEASGMPNFYAIAKTHDDQLVVKNTVIPRNKPAYSISINNGTFITSYTDYEDNMYYDNNYHLGKFNVHTGKLKIMLPIDEKLVSILPFAGNKSLLVCTHKSLSLVTQGGKQLWKKMLPIKYSDVKATGLYSMGGDDYMLLTNMGAKWYNLNTNQVSKSIMDSVSFRSYYKDQAGRIWFGSDGGGAFMYQNGQVYPLPLGDQKSLKTVHAFIDDGRGQFWLPTNNGLYRVSINQLADYVTQKKKTLYFYTLNNKDGLLTNEFNGGSNPSYQWLSDSTLVLPSMQGLLEFQPFKIKINYPDNKIFLDGIKVDTTDVMLSSLKEVLLLPPDFNLLHIKVSCPYFGNPGNLQLEYTIDNHDLQSNWLQVPASGLLMVNRLPAGNYEIAIRKAGYSAKGENGGVVIKFTVRPHFYNTWWFYTLMLLVFALAGYVFSRRRIIHLEKEKLRIEKLVAERTCELNQVAQQLKVSERALINSNKVKEQVIAIVLHDLRSPIRFLGTISNNLVKGFKEENPDRFYGNLKRLNKSVSMLWGFIDQFFSWAVIQQDAFKVKKVFFPLRELFEETAGFYEEILSYNENKFLVVPTDLDCHTDKDILSLILRNLVDNANKHTEKGDITLSAFEEEGSIHITVSDTGSGLSASQVKMFTDDRRDASEHGIGSIVIQNMLHKIGGNLRVQTLPGVGSSFRITIPR
ncbi:MAG TPA: HAMP domain-containing sensor histidine kinase, partial [Arachidicoccus sp.]|nr:HAMP domain-containing sensor histidine kinase [Arachidicoccus sp.]